MPILGLVLASALLAPRTSVTVPLEQSGHTYFIKARVNGVLAKLEIDTGSFELRLTPEFARKHGMAKDQAAKFSVGQLAIATLEPLIERIDPADAEPIEKSGLDGIIGLDVLSKISFGLDFRAREVTFWKGGPLDDATVSRWYGGKTPAPMPLTRKGDEDWFVMPVKIGSIVRSFIVDTGTVYCSINPSLAKLAGLRRVGRTEIVTIGDTEWNDVAVASSIRFGEFEAEFPMLGIEPKDDPDSDGILGMDAVGVGKLLFDLPGSRWFLERQAMPSGNPFADRLRRYGLQSFLSERDQLVLVVKPGSSAALAGFNSGDVVLTIGGINPSEIKSFVDGDSPSPDSGARLLQFGLKVMMQPLDIKARSPQSGKTIIATIPLAS